MTPGSTVVYLARPSWGLGVVLRIEPDGTLFVGFELEDGPFSDDFHPQELEEAHRIATQTGLPRVKRAA